MFTFWTWYLSRFLSFILCTLVFIWNMFFFIYFFDISLQTFCSRCFFFLSMFRHFRFSLYVFLLFVISCIGTFWTHSSSFMFLFVRFEVQTTHDCSNLVMILKCIMFEMFKQTLLRTCTCWNINNIMFIFWPTIWQEIFLRALSVSAQITGRCNCFC